MESLISEKIVVIVHKISKMHVLIFEKRLDLFVEMVKLKVVKHVKHVKKMLVLVLLSVEIILLKNERPVRIVLRTLKFVLRELAEIKK
jgi:hypothetical protein